MLFLVIERFRNGDPAPAYRRFRESGRLEPPGVAYVASWVTADLSACYQVMECDGRAALDAWIARWSDLVDFEVVPVISSAEAAGRVGGTSPLGRAQTSLPSLDEEIARHLRESLAAGELRQAPSFGKPMQANDGFDETPADLRMPFKILKDAGVPPPEIALFHRRAELRRELASASEPAQRVALGKALAELEQVIALRLEAMRSGSR